MIVYSCVKFFREGCYGFDLCVFDDDFDLLVVCNDDFWRW